MKVARGALAVADLRFEETGGTKGTTAVLERVPGPTLACVVDSHESGFAFASGEVVIGLLVLGAEVT